MPKKNKYKYLLVIQQMYAGYWEDLSEYDKDNVSEIKACMYDAKEYRFMGYPTRIINRRELNLQEST